MGSKPRLWGSHLKIWPREWQIVLENWSRSKLTTQKYFVWRRQEEAGNFASSFEKQFQLQFSGILRPNLYNNLFFILLFQKNIITLRLKPATSPSREMATKVKLLQQSRSRTNLVDPDQTKTADKCSSSVTNELFLNIADKVSKFAALFDGLQKKTLIFPYSQLLQWFLTYNKMLYFELVLILEVEIYNQFNNCIAKKNYKFATFKINSSDLATTVQLWRAVYPDKNKNNVKKNHNFMRSNQVQ